jgi:RNA polymerase sigma factor (sigma-70 family)
VRLFKSTSGKSEPPEDSQAAQPDRLAKALQAPQGSLSADEAAWLEDELSKLRETLIRVAEHRGLRDEAEDVVQRAIAILFEKRDELTYGNTYRFALVILRNLILGEWRRRSRAAGKTSDVDPSDLQLEDPSSDPYEVMIEETFRREAAGCVEAALQKLKPEDREFLLNYHDKVEEQSVGFLARLLGKSEAALKKRASRLRGRVHQLASPCLRRIGHPGAARPPRTGAKQNGDSKQ